MSVQNLKFLLLGSLFFLINSQLAFSWHVSQRCLAGTTKKTFDLERITVQKITFGLYVWKPLKPEIFSLSVPFSKITHEHSKNIRFSPSHEPQWGLNKKSGVAG